MNLSRENIEKYFGKKKATIFISLISTFIGLGMIIYFGLMYFGIIGMNPNDAKAFVNDKYIEGVSYLDIIGVDEEFAYRDNESARLVIDSNGKYYIINMEKKLVSSLTEQLNYAKEVLINDNKDAKKPTPFRFYGVSKSIDSEIRGYFESFYKLQSYTSKQIIGDYILEDDNFQSKSLEIFGALSGIIIFAIALSIFISNKNRNKRLEESLNRLDQDQLINEADRELSKALSDGEYSKNFVLTENYVFNKRDGRILRYDDIVWAYKYFLKYYGFIKVRKEIHCNLIDGKKSSLFLPITTREEVSDAMLAKMLEKNPDLILGFTWDNQKLYKTYLGAK